MKLILQIALGVFLGTLAAQVTFDAWRTHRENSVKAAEEKLRAEEEQAREAQAKKIHDLLMRNLHGKNPSPVVVPPGFAPDDAQDPTLVYPDR